jgi:hypothetical protein
MSVFVASANREEDFTRPNPRNVLANATPSSLGKEDQWTLIGGCCGHWNVNWIMVACILSQIRPGKVVWSSSSCLLAKKEAQGGASSGTLEFQGLQTGTLRIVK